MDSFIEGIKSLNSYKNQIEHIEYLPPKKGEHGTLDSPLLPSIQQYLNNRQIKLYKHQADAINLARKGENIVITTPTASGKTLAFNIPVFEAMSRDPQARALCARARGRRRVIETANMCIDESISCLDFDPYDIKSLFSPIDFVVFNGMNHSKELDEIVFLGQESNNQTRKSLQKTIEDENYDFRIARVSDEGSVDFE